MKNLKFCILFLAILPFFISCQTKEKKETFNLTLKLDINEGEVYLRSSYPFDKEILDTAKIVNGQCNFTGEVKFPIFSELIIRSEKNNFTGRNVKYYSFILENKDIIIDYSCQNEDQIKISGSPLNDKFNSFEEVEKYQNDMRQLYDKMSEAYHNEKKDELSDLQNQEKLRQNEFKVFIANSVLENPKSILHVLIVFGYLNDCPYEELEKIILQFDPSLQKNPYLKNLTDKIEKLKKTEIGKIAPDFALNDTTGKSIALSSLRGKYVLVDFWASWCAPCCHEIPEILKIYNQYKKENFEILGVSFDGKKSAWVNAIQKYNMSWLNVSDLKGWDCEAGNLYNVRAIPFNIIIDPEGKILAKNLHDEELIQFLSSVF